MIDLKTKLNKESRRVKKLRRTQKAVKHSVLTTPASRPLDFIRLPRKLTIFGAEHVFRPPTLAHSAHFTLRHGQSTAAADHPVPEPTDRGFAQEARKEAVNSVPISRLDSLTLDCQSTFLSTRYFASRGSGNVSRPNPPGATLIGCQ